MPSDPHEPTEEELERRLQKLLGEAETAQSDEELDEIELKLRDITDKLEGTSAASKDELEEIEDEFDKKLRELHQRVDSVKQTKERKEQAQLKIQKQEQSSARGAGIGLAIAYTIIGVPMLGVILGYALQEATGNKVWMSVCVLIGAVLGLAMAVVMMNRTNPKS